MLGPSAPWRRFGGASRRLLGVLATWRFVGRPWLGRAVEVGFAVGAGGIGLRALEGESVSHRAGSGKGLLTLGSTAYYLVVMQLVSPPPPFTVSPVSERSFGALTISPSSNLNLEQSRPDVIPPVRRRYEIRVVYNDLGTVSSSPDYNSSCPPPQLSSQATSGQVEPFLIIAQMAKEADEDHLLTLFVQLQY